MSGNCLEAGPPRPEPAPDAIPPQGHAVGRSRPRLASTGRDAAAGAAVRTATRILRLLIALQLANITRAADYGREIQPVLRSRCYACHGALQQKAGLRLDTVQSMLRGGKDGPAVVPGDALASPILVRVSATTSSERMPPEGEPLTASEIGAISAWIRAGALPPEHDVPEPDPRDHWAFKEPARPAVPGTRIPGFPIRNPIDAFIAESLVSHGLEPRVSADPATLLRRLTLDLTGLPPTTAELESFIAHPTDEEYERRVDQLLARPSHGERWARHWMDVWRYADWYGRRQVPDVWNSAPQVWRWRDWIVRSLNGDRSYAAMLASMLAADELDPGNAEEAVATGFLVRNWYALNPNQWMRDNVEHTSKAFLGLTLHCAHCHDHKYDPMTQRDYFRFRAFFEPLGLRQDRIPGEPDPGPFQKYEYSSLRKVVTNGIVRVFDEAPDAPTHLYLRGDERLVPPDKPVVEPGVPAFLSRNAPPVRKVTLPPSVTRPGLIDWAVQSDIDDRRKAVENAERAARDLTAALDHATPVTPVLASMANPADAQLRAASLVQRAATELQLASARARLDAARSELEALEARVSADRKLAGGADASADGFAETLRTAVESERRSTIARLTTQRIDAENALALLTAEQQLAAVRRGKPGAPATPEEAAARRKLEDALVPIREALAKAATPGTNTHSPRHTPVGPQFGGSSSGRRRALAQWVAGRDHPLTARVAVNHVWSRHFHRPLVDTVFDFGRNGTPPSHPALLDWLAVAFMDSGWSLKQLHRWIVTSSAYRQSSSATAPAASAQADVGQAKTPADRADPENRWLWRMNQGRMESEILRDSLLAVAGRIEIRLGGPSIPHDAGEHSLRRSLYLECHPEGGGHGAFMEQFDPPDPSDCYRRTRTIVPQQALALANGPLTTRVAQSLADPSPDDRDSGTFPPPETDLAFIRAAFLRLLSRPANPAEERACMEFLDTQKTLLGPPSDPETGPATWSRTVRESLARALLNHNDFLSVR